MEAASQDAARHRSFVSRTRTRQGRVRTGVNGCGECRNHFAFIPRKVRARPAARIGDRPFSHAASFTHTRSKTAAMPCPPAIHIVTTPYFPPLPSHSLTTLLPLLH